jgi:hypothetical protein
MDRCKQLFDRRPRAIGPYLRSVIATQTSGDSYAYLCLHNDQRTKLATVKPLAETASSDDDRRADLHRRAHATTCSPELSLRSDDQDTHRISYGLHRRRTRQLDPGNRPLLYNGPAPLVPRRMPGRAKMRIAVGTYLPIAMAGKRLNADFSPHTMLQVLSVTS